MNSKIKRIYVPMTESGFYILFCLQQPHHGYGISQQVKQMTDVYKRQLFFSPLFFPFHVFDQIPLHVLLVLGVQLGGGHLLVV